MSASVTQPVKKEIFQVNLLQLGVEFAVIIAIPLLVFIVSGVYVDRMMQTTPLFIIGGVVLSLAISSAMLYKKITTVFKSLQSPRK